MPSISIILAHIPTWVWAVFAFILVMGVIQSRDQLMARARLLILPLAWTVFGAWGVETAFGLGVGPLSAWALGLVASLWLVKRSGWPGAARFDAPSQRFFVPGSWLPMALMLAIFIGKFTLGFSLAMRPELASDTVVAAAFSLYFGAISGVFLGRSRNILSRAPAALNTVRA